MPVVVGDPAVVDDPAEPAGAAVVVGPAVVDGAAVVVVACGPDGEAGAPVVGLTGKPGGASHGTLVVGAGVGAAPGAVTVGAQPKLR